MPSSIHGFIFDVNFGFGSESVFSPYENVEGAVSPPIEGYFLLLDGTNFLLLDDEDLTLL